MGKRVLLGMSGGIDSSVAAISLLRQGYHVAGVTFLFGGEPEDLLKNSEAAKQLADSIGIEHHTVDLRKEFDELVLQYFKDSYLQGLTPFPCAVCNPQLKFAKLIEMANQMNCDMISTGHYVQVTENQAVKYVTEGVDPDKDQSFFLWGLSKNIIGRLIFPLGKFHKKEVRQLAQKHSFQFLNEKKESTGICFINGGDYRKYLSDNGIKARPGQFVDMKGNILGIHDGIINYTIGQRRGLNLHVNKPLFVSELRSATNEVVLGDYNDLYRSRIFLHNIHFVDINRMDNNKVYKVRIRYRNQENECRVLFHGKQNVEIELLNPVAMVAPGQTAVIYDENRVLGGGFIERSE